MTSGSGILCSEICWTLTKYYLKISTMRLLSLLHSLRHMVLTTAGDKIWDNSGFWSNPAQHFCVLTLIRISVNLLVSTPETLSSLILLEACSSSYDFCHEYCIPLLLQAIAFYCTRKETVLSSKRKHIQVIKSKNIWQCCSLTWQLATKHKTATRSPLHSPPSKVGRSNGQRGKSGVEIKTV